MRIYRIAGGALIIAHTCSGGTVVTRPRAPLALLAGGTSKMGRLSWVVGAIHRAIRECYGNGGISTVLSALELKLELEDRG